MRPLSPTETETAHLSLQRGSATPLPEGFLVGSAQNSEAGTGCTVICCPEGAIASVAVRGGAPATRETDLLKPSNTVQAIHAIMLSGGSAFGLDAATGAMRWLSERAIGFELAGCHVPLVCGASLFDLTVGAASAWPDADMGYAACEAAQTSVVCGNVGAGTGASVGKLLGAPYAMKAGLGAAGIVFGELIVSAVVALNALGNVAGRTPDSWIAGTRNPAQPNELLTPWQSVLASPLANLSEVDIPHKTQQASNTTIACVLTNAQLSKTEMSRIASSAHDGYARALEPVHSSLDGDAIFALTRGFVSASADLVGIVAARVVEEAIYEAAWAAESAYGLPAARDLISDDSFLDRDQIEGTERP